MARPAPAVHRAVDVVDLLVASPTERFTLSEIVRRTAMSLGSAHAVLAALTERGHLSRDPATKTYTLGPALAAAGFATVDGQNALGAAVAGLGTLADTLECETVATAATSTEIIMLARAGELSAYSVDVRIGQRIPLVAPMGAVFVAWADPDVVERWLGSRPCAAGRRSALPSSILDAARANGYTIALASDAQRRAGTLLAALADDPSQTDLHAELADRLAELARSEHELTSIDPTAHYDVGVVATPVFDPAGRVAAAISATGFAPGMPGTTLAETAEAVRAAGIVATRRAGGRLPG